MRIPFFGFDGTGNLVEGLAADAEVLFLKRLNRNGTLDDLIDEAPDVDELGGGAYSFVLSDSWFESGCSINALIDLGIDAFPRYVEIHQFAGELGDDENPPSPEVTASVEAFTMKKGDLLPVFERVLHDESGAPLDLSGEGITVAFRMRQADGGVLKIDDAEAEIVNDGKKGRVRYVWDEGDTDLVGTFDAEFIVSDGPRTLPSSHYFRIEIISNLAD